MLSASWHSSKSLLKSRVVSYVMKNKMRELSSSSSLLSFCDLVSDRKKVEHPFSETNLQPLGGFDRVAQVDKDLPSLAL